MSRIYNGIMGLVVGDALGVPAEFKPRDSFEIKGMTGYGTHNQPIGTWSDDSSMTLATVESIGRLGKINPRDIMENFVRWYYNGEFTPYGEVFDIGNATANAIEKYINSADITNCGGKGKLENGNGALMRILPLAFVPWATKQDVEDVAHLTHAHEISTKACLYYESIARGIRTENVVLYKGVEHSKEFSRTLHIWDFPRDKIKSTGYVVDTLEAALWCFFNTYSYRDCVLTAVNLGDDTDTVAAVAGGLAGTLYGVGGEMGIPEEWIAQIARKDWIKELCDTMERVCEGGKAND